VIGGFKIRGLLSLRQIDVADMSRAEDEVKKSLKYAKFEGAIEFSWMSFSCAQWERLMEGQILSMKLLSPV
jgi:hypothetical protein